MAKAKIPDPLERRHLIENELNPDRALAVAEAYLAEGRSLEAVAFLAKADAGDLLQELRDRAVEVGDTFLMQTVTSATGVQPGPEMWQRLAESAEREGKTLYAQLARRQSRVGSD